MADDEASTQRHREPSLDSLLMAAASGLLSELMMTKPKPSLSFRLMMTSLGCVLAADVLSEAAAAAGAWVGPVLLAYVKSLRGELCCVETEPGLRPFSGQDSPAGGAGAESLQTADCHCHYVVKRIIKTQPEQKQLLAPLASVHLAVACGAVHQVDDVAVRLPHHRDPVHEQQLVSGPQAPVQVRRTLLDDRPDQNLLLRVKTLHTGRGGPDRSVSCPASSPPSTRKPKPDFCLRRCTSMSRYSAPEATGENKAAEP
ncbi:hypothetical protein EYF80_044166 [Liparis tanakae]|uniref:Uncharacterized protein n=1 Tax=Liparis tanakae TaxID=230148 RepID=A0A4Z2FXL6_9TELE|nr:hypothetical protein EYF80_044166 [Liparis tanakae]